jgi:hypothetical protein
MILFGCEGWSGVGKLCKLTGADATQPEVFRKVSTNSWRNSSGPNVLQYQRMAEHGEIDAN